MPEELNANVLSLIVVVMMLGFLPFVAVAVTAFAKITVVLLIVRNALGVQQTPPNMVIYGIALVLTVYIAAPLAAQLQAVVGDPSLSFETLDDWLIVFERGVEPIREFLLRHARVEDRAFFMEATAAVWGPELAQGVENDSLSVLVPAFLVSELTRAFEIGFLLYLPFLAVDLIVSAILMSLGMMMVSPIMIAIPFKLFLFVAVDGWSRLVQGLVLSYT